MFEKGILRLRVILLFVGLSFVGVVQGQDSIPEPASQPPIESPTPPTDITPDAPTENTQSEQNTTTTSTENRSTNIPQNAIDAGEYVFREDLPQPIERPKEDPELLAALEDNPFGLIRDGKPKIGRLSVHGLPGYASTAAVEEVEVPEEEERIEEEVIEEEEVFVPIDTTTQALNALNPFRLEGTPEDRQSGTLAKKIKFNPQAGSGAKSTDDIGFNPIFDTSKVNVNPLGTLKFIVIILLLGILTYIVSSFRNDVVEVYRGFLNGNLLSLLYRDKGTLLYLPYIAMYILTACSFGTMIFLAINLLDGKIFESNFWSIIVCTIGSGLIFLLRHFSITVLGTIFPFRKEIKLYGFLIAVFNFVIGIGLIPVITLIAFAPSSSHEIILYATLIAFGIAYIFRTIRAIIIGNKYLINNKFHFFMYLCTVELAPIMILLKLLGY